MTILIENPTNSKSDRDKLGRTDGGKLVLMPPSDYKIGELVAVRIVDATPHALKAQPVL